MASAVASSSPAIHQLLFQRTKISRNGVFEQEAPSLLTRRFNALLLDKRRQGSKVELIKTKYKKSENEILPPPDAVSSADGRRTNFWKIWASRAAIGIFALGFIDAGYSGDWSRIGVISEGVEDFLKMAASLPLLHYYSLQCPPAAVTCMLHPVNFSVSLTNEGLTKLNVLPVSNRTSADISLKRPHNRIVCKRPVPSTAWRET